MKKLIDNKSHFFEMDSRIKRNPSGVYLEKGHKYMINVAELKEKWKD
ncbi:hypothetical protein [Portibacter marinus]|nr:hypothetical protein [Portibacter marinus]